MIKYFIQCYNKACRRCGVITPHKINIDNHLQCQVCGEVYGYGTKVGR